MRPAWDSLFRSGDYTLFQSFTWNRLAARVFAHRLQPHVVMAQSDSGLAVIPACIGDSGVELLGDALFDYRDVLHTGDPAVLRRAWDAVAALRKPASVTAVRGARAHVWSALAPEFFCNAPMVRRSDSDSEAFAAEHSRLARNFRRLAREGIILNQHFGDNSPLLELIYRRKGEQFANSAHDIFTDRSRVEFMRQAGWLDPRAVEIFTFETTSDVVAALVTLRDSTTRRFYTVWYDERWDRHSPGVVLVFAITQRSLAEGLDCDYMTGEQPHKLRLATRMEPLYRVQAAAEQLASLAMPARVAAVESELAA